MGCSSNEYSYNSEYKIYKSVQISKTDLGSNWPFTVESGYVDCYEFNDGRRAWFFKTLSGMSYPVNGIAKGATRMFQINNNDIDNIWEKDPEYPELKINIGPFIDKGNKICGT